MILPALLLGALATPAVPALAPAAPAPAALPTLAAPAPADLDYERALVDGLVQAFPRALGLEQGEPPPPGDRWLFEDALRSAAFTAESVGPFDVYVYERGAYAEPRVAERIAGNARSGLAPLATLFEELFPRQDGVVSGRRFPIVLAHGDEEQPAFDELLAMLDWCEADYTGWKDGGSPVWSPGARESLTARNWEVLLVNMAHAEPSAHGQEFFDHGLGYHVVAHVANRLLRRGAWGNVPTWVAQGLIDELDIQAYGSAWVGSDTFEWELEGWFREGWEGFVPQGSSPPPPITGPPADRAKTVRDTSDPWDARKTSPERHWAVLAAEKDSPDAGSFEAMSRYSGFPPRDRAYARALFFLIFGVAHERGAALLAALDAPEQQLDGGMPLAEPLPVLVARALGGVTAVDHLESLPTEAVMEEVGQPTVNQRLVRLGASASLALTDHRDQARWLVEQPDFEWDARNSIFDLFLAAEYFQQRAEWEHIGRAADALVASALEASPSFPRSATERRALAQALARGD